MYGIVFMRRQAKRTGGAGDRGETPDMYSYVKLGGSIDLQI